jgi:hypothetical protein
MPDSRTPNRSRSATVRTRWANADSTAAVTGQHPITATCRSPTWVATSSSAAQQPRPSRSIPQRLWRMRTQGPCDAAGSIAVGKDHEPGLAPVRRTERGAHDALLGVVRSPVGNFSRAIGTG